MEFSRLPGTRRDISSVKSVGSKSALDNDLSPTAKRGKPVAVHTRLPFSQGRVGLGAAVMLHPAAADLAYYQRHKGVVWFQRRPNEALRHAFLH